MHKDIELLMALHDGELSPEDERRAQAVLAADPEAQRVMQDLQRADQEFARFSDDLLKAPVPQRLLDAVQGTQPAAAPSNVYPFPRRKALVGLAMAAGLTAVMVYLPFEPPGIGAGGDSGYAALLQQTLESAPSGDILSTEDNLVQVSAVVSYRTADAQFCREYIAREGERELSGVACRVGPGNWEVRQQQVLAGADDGSRYRAAGGGDENSDENSTESAILDSASPLSYAEENAALSSGWSGSSLEGAQ